MAIFDFIARFGAFILDGIVALGNFTLFLVRAVLFDRLKSLLPSTKKKNLPTRFILKSWRYLPGKAGMILQWTFTTSWIPPKPNPSNSGVPSGCSDTKCQFLLEAGFATPLVPNYASGVKPRTMSKCAVSSPMRELLRGAKSTMTESRALPSRMPRKTPSRSFRDSPLM